VPVLMIDGPSMMEEMRRSKVDGKKPRRRKKPAPVGTIVDGVLDHIGIREHVERSATAACWAEVAGPYIAKVTRTAGLKGGVLFIEVANAAWMNELNMRRRTLLDRLNVDRERGRIERLVFLQSDGGSIVKPLGDEKLRGDG